MVYDLTGQRFGRLLVECRINSANRAKSGTSREICWQCLCDCGKQKTVKSSNLRRGLVKSCGCLRVSIAHSLSYKHGKRHTKEYATFTQMKQRCNNPSSASWKNYGGRGISYDPRWENFEVFLEDVGVAPGKEYSLDRYPDNNGNYEPGNVRWATPKQQLRNTRHNVLIEFEGEIKTTSEWEEITGIHQDTIRFRLRSGWSAKDILTTPPSLNNKKRFTQEKFIKWNGEIKSISAWERELGFGVGTLSGRLRTGWDLERAFTTPVKKRQTYLEVTSLKEK